MIVHNCPDCGTKMIWISEHKVVKTIWEDDVEIPAEIRSPHYECPNCYTSTDKTGKYQWKEVDQNAQR